MGTMAIDGLLLAFQRKHNCNFFSFSNSTWAGFTVFPLFDVCAQEVMALNTALACVDKGETELRHAETLCDASSSYRALWVCEEALEAQWAVKEPHKVFYCAIVASLTALLSRDDLTAPVHRLISTRLLRSERCKKIRFAGVLRLLIWDPDDILH